MKNAASRLPSDDDTNACALVAAENHDKRLELFAIGDDSVIYHKSQSKGQAGWTQWDKLLSSPKRHGGLEVSRAASGQLILLVCADDGSIRLAVQESANAVGPGSWGAWQQLAGPPDGGCAHRPTVLVDAEGHAHTFAVSKGGLKLWENVRTAQSDCSLAATSASVERCGEWRSLGGEVEAAPTASLDSEGRIHLFLLGPAGAVFTRQQEWLPRGGTQWSEWKALVGGASSSPQLPAVAGSTHLFNVFARGRDHAVYHVRQTPLASRTVEHAAQWLPWDRIGGVVASAPAAAANIDGLLQLFAIGADRTLWQARQYFGEVRGKRSASSPAVELQWSAWSSLGGEASAAPTLVTRSDGLIEAFIRGADRNVYRKPQIHQAGNLTWGEWEFVGGPVAAFAC